MRSLGLEWTGISDRWMAGPPVYRFLSADLSEAEAWICLVLGLPSVVREIWGSPRSSQGNAATDGSLPSCLPHVARGTEVWANIRDLQVEPLQFRATMGCVSVVPRKPFQQNQVPIRGPKCSRRGSKLTCILVGLVPKDVGEVDTPDHIGLIGGVFVLHDERGAPHPHTVVRPVRS